MLEEYIYISDDGISTKICDNILTYYHSNKNSMYKGVTRAGKDAKVKDTTDIHLRMNAKGYGADILNIVSDVLGMHLKTYTSLHPEYKYYEKILLTEGVLIQRYKKNEGKYVYHTDMSYEVNENILIETNKLNLCRNTLNNLKEKYPITKRVLTFIIYLNDIDEGGETEFFTHCRVKPKAGTIIFFQHYGIIITVG